MPNLAVIAVVLIGGLVIGSVLFFPMRWWTMRSVQEEKNLPIATRGHILQSCLLVGFLLTLAWYMEAGSKLAALAFSVLMLVANIGAYFYLNRSKPRNDHSDT